MGSPVPKVIACLAWLCSFSAPLIFSSTVAPQYPQLSAVIECADAAHGLGGHIVADGGCTCPVSAHDQVLHLFLRKCGFFGGASPPSSALLILSCGLAS
jgi:hypothetical protein